jgi:hypothetical protein
VCPGVQPVSGGSGRSEWGVAGCSHATGVGERVGPWLGCATGEWRFREEEAEGGGRSAPEAWQGRLIICVEIGRDIAHSFLTGGVAEGVGSVGM